MQGTQVISAIQLIALRHARQSVRPSAWNKSTPTGWKYMKFYIWIFHANLSWRFKFHLTLTGMTGTVQEQVCIIVIFSNWIFLKIRNFWVKRDQLDVTCFIISLFNAQHVSDVNTSILRCLRIICWVISWVVLLWFDVCWCYFVVWLWWCGVRMQAKALSKEIIKKVTSSWSLFTQLSRLCTVQ